MSDEEKDTKTELSSEPEEPKPGPAEEPDDERKPEEIRPKREPRPNPKYDEDEKALREKERQRKDKFKVVQKLLREIQAHMQDEEVDEVAELKSELDDMIKDLQKVQKMIVKDSKLPKKTKNKMEEEIHLLLENQNTVHEWLKNRKEVDDDDDDESDDEDPVDLKAMLKSLKQCNEKLVNNQTKALTKITTTLQDSLTAPKQDIAKFDGNPQNYQKFWSSFEAATKSIKDDQVRLNHLIHNCIGEAKEAIEDYIILKPSEGLKEATETLKKRYGRPHLIARSYIDGLVKGPQLKPGDTEGLSRLSLAMNKCKMTLKATGYSADLNNSDTLLKIVRRLPMHQRGKWAERADIILETGDEPNFDHLSAFIERNSRVATNMYGQDMSNKNERSNPAKSSRSSTYSTAMKAPEPQSHKTQLHCNYCGRDHQTWRCDDFLKLPYNDRKQATRTKGLCDNCFNRGHISKECPKRKFCSVEGCAIRYKHSTFLHPPSFPINQNPIQQIQNQYSINTLPNPSPSSAPLAFPTGNSYSATTNSETAVCLKVVPVQVMNNDKTFETYALLDNCSSSTMCTKSLLKKLNITGNSETIHLNTVSGKLHPTIVQKARMNIQSIDGDTQIYLQKVWAVDDLNIPNECIAKQLDLEKLPHLQGIYLPRTEAKKVELLIGGDNQDVFWTLEERRGEKRDPIAVKTMFGWTVTGPMTRWKQRNEHTVNFIKLSLEDSVERMWKTEFNDVPTLKSSMSVEDQQALDIMNTSKRKVHGHYEVSLPFRHDPPHLPHNRDMAMTRLHSLKRRLAKDDNPKLKYSNEIQKYIDKGFAEEVTNDDNAIRPKWYLPHHAVTNPKKPDKMRIVFDCSASYQGKSLNEELLQGPDLMNDLAGVLMRFREHPIALSSDIEAMFHQVRVTPNDTDVLRFIWWKNGDLTQEPVDHKMLVHLFGATSSPSVCCYILRKTAEDNSHLYSNEATQTVLRNFYMDDCLKSVETVEEAIKLQEELRNMLERGGFRLTKWMSSSKEVISAIPESERAPSVQSVTIDELPTERTLGVQWNIEADDFRFTPQVKSKPFTKRGILSAVSSLYDPLGLVSPVILTAKMILQNLCRRKMEWDDEIDTDTAQRWREWLESLPALCSESVPRCYRPPTFRIARTELHHFSDASENGYGAVSYLRFTDETDQIHCSIVIGKSRLAPLKTTTIPRLELSAAVVAIRLNTMLKEQLTISVNQIFFWTDSTAVLQYIRNTNKRFKTYVANRLTIIHEGSNVAQWKHVGTKQNPADFASRGLMPTDADKLKFWHSGPEYLWMNERSWPKQPESIPPLESDDEIKRDQSFFSQEATTGTNIEDLIETYSSWYSLQKAIAWLTRFKKFCMHKYLKDKPVPEASPLTVQDLKDATIDIVKFVQRETYLKDIESLRTNPNKRTNGDLCKLNPVLINDTLRVGGRLQNAPIPETQKHPVILPGKHHLTELILRHHHAALGHSGSDIVLNSVRKQFWVTSGKYAIRKIIDKCVKCKRASAPRGEQFMAPLPVVRVTPDKPPFSSTGVDYFGPIYVKQGRSEVKRYGCLFTCLATRAVHIEVAHSMTTDSFLGALQRFINRRGQPDKIYSDNGTNFTSANKELKKSLQELNQTKIYDHLRLKQIEWKFNPPAASHMGGIWERMIRTTRRILHMLLGEQRINDECLLTLLAEVEKIINDRPLTTPSSDATDPHPLSPNDLLLLRPNASIPTGIYDKMSCYTRRWYHQAQYLASVFWKRWVREYLPTLQERQKWQTVRRNFKVNDIVLVRDEQIPRGRWPLARIVETYPDTSGLVRSVKLQTAGTFKIRPIVKLCLLEAAE